MSDPFSFDSVDDGKVPDEAATDSLTEEIICRRCGKAVLLGPPKCKYCDARLPQTAPTHTGGNPLVVAYSPGALELESAHDYQALTRLMVFYLILLATNIFAAAVARTVDQTQPDEAIAEQHLRIMLVAEVVDTFIVLISLTMIPRPPRFGVVGLGRRLTSWFVSPALLAALLGINHAYHWLLNNYIQFPEWANLPAEKITPLTIVVICIQPAIVEELFFRYLSLGTLRRVMGMGAAICISSIMFGMAHSGAVLSIPILTVIGAGLALARVWSGGLLLPMVLHALHNGAVLYLESNS